MQQGVEGDQGGAAQVTGAVQGAAQTGHVRVIETVTPTESQQAGPYSPVT